MIVKGLIFGSRLFGTAALLVGAAYWMGMSVPLHAHMGLGGVMAVCLLVLAILGLRRTAGLAVLAGIWALAVPVIGMAQLHWPLGDAQWVLRLVHVLVGLGALVLAEVLARRLRRG